MSKTSVYSEVLQRIEALVEGETDRISVMSTICCELFNAFDDFNWVGFYRRVAPKTLKVGPYQGGHGCLTIDINRGVCGACARQAAVQLENDVSKAEHHIACSSETRAELVIPLFDNAGVVCGVLDIDSTRQGVFDEADVDFLKRICALLPSRDSV